MSENADKIARLETLLEKMEKIEGQPPVGPDDTEQMTKTLEQILIKMEAIQTQKAKQDEANKKLEQVLGYMESTIGQGTQIQPIPDKPPLEESLKNILKTAQASGKVLELLAGSLMIVLEAAVKVVKTNEQTPLARTDSPKTGAQPDFSTILAALSSYVQGMSTEK